MTRIKLTGPAWKKREDKTTEPRRGDIVEGHPVEHEVIAWVFMSDTAFGHLEYFAAREGAYAAEEVGR